MTTNDPDKYITVTHSTDDANNVYEFANVEIINGRTVNSAHHTISWLSEQNSQLMEENEELYQQAFIWKWWFYFTWTATIVAMIGLFIIRAWT